MKSASLNELKSELKMLSPNQLLDVCLHLVKYKKENKELLSYLLFEASDEASYVKSVKEMIEEQFDEINKSNLYLAKKTIRKILRTTSKYIKYSGNKQTEVELLLFFCKKLKFSKIPLTLNSVIGNIYNRQLLNAGKALATMHEDLQYDYLEEVKLLI